MKKTMAYSMVSLLLVTSLAACGSNNESANNDKDAAANANSNTTANGGTNGSAPANEGSADAGGDADISGKVVFLTNRTDMVDKEYKDYETRFEAKYPKVDLQFEAITDYDKNEKIRIASGSFPDVVLLSTLIPNAEFPKYFEPLDDITFEGDIYFKDFKSFEGKSYGISSGNSTVGIVYNKKAFEKAGITAIPKTYDEFLAAAQKLKDAGIVPLASNFKDKWPLGAWYNDVPAIISGKADTANNRKDTDTPFTLDNTYGKSFSIIKELYAKGFLEKDVNSTNWEQSKKDVAQGKFGMYLLGNWVINQVVDAGAKTEDVGFFPFPADNSGQAKAPLNPDWFYGVNKDGNVPAAKAFIKWMIEESGYDDFAGFIPTLKSKEPKLAQLTEFNGYKPTFVEALPTDDTALSIQNKAQIDMDGLVQEFVLAKDPQKVLDKVNGQWAKARKEIVK
ncbi:ABC transporter substrate-binding protein [Paenibacillus sacheonensis]|uniref:Extracellular solute-binding protein n=1 Tax=Paenibacillus sacheonensis TaxID=742054 RepID=A0A7X4YNK9_9BACL|nr:extracellular solute-binding protein [Paenibacillus sacheonensis]MBM7565947.1 ABC-type glycerol-3-phosphate transport system substrate-binding protein [Paenibacillus sacheonensis]NBC68739.1 extracellular solute-binding protein [Paenibacillus sacheonensis]